MLNLDPKEQEAHCQIYGPGGNTDSNPYILFYEIFIQLHGGDIFAAFVVVCIKGKYDLLEGFNKLDNLIKVSLF